MAPEATILARFAHELDRLIDPGERFGVAVSGGPDSVALLLLAAAARPGKVEAITVDHALRPEAAAEAAMVKQICSKLTVPHTVRKAEWDEKPDTALQERAREARYRLIAEWMRERALKLVCTAHHADDQAETMLMRLARGAGVRGLAAMRECSPLPAAEGLKLIRPLLDWRRSELAQICSSAGIDPAADPGNEDPHFERVRIRQAIASLDLDAQALAKSAAHLQSLDDAFDWAVTLVAAERVRRADGGITYRPGAAPAEISRRIVARIIADLAHEGPKELRGRELDRLIETLAQGGVATLRGVRAQGGDGWHFKPAPARSLGCG